MTPRGMNICKKNPPKMLSSTFTLSLPLSLFLSPDASPASSASVWSSPPPPASSPSTGARGRRGRRRPWNLRTPRSPPPLARRFLRSVSSRWHGGAGAPPPLAQREELVAAAHPAGHRGAPRRRRARHRRRRVGVLLRAVVRADAGQRQRARQLGKGRRSCSSTPWRSRRRRSSCSRRPTRHGRSPSASCSTR